MQAMYEKIHSGDLALAGTPDYAGRIGGDLLADTIVAPLRPGFHGPEMLVPTEGVNESEGSEGGGGAMLFANKWQRHLGAIGGIDSQELKKPQALGDLSPEQISFINRPIQYYRHTCMVCHGGYLQGRIQWEELSSEQQFSLVRFGRNEPSPELKAVYLGMAGAGTATAGGAAIIVCGPTAVGGFLLTEAGEFAFEEATGIPVIIDPKDLLEAGAKRIGKRGVRSAAPVEFTPPPSVYFGIGPTGEFQRYFDELKVVRKSKAEVKAEVQLDSLARLTGDVKYKGRNIREYDGRYGPGEEIDWIDDAGRTCDHMGFPDMIPRWELQRAKFYKKLHDHLQKVDYTVIDLTQFPTSIKQEIATYVLSLPNDQFNKIIPIGF